MTQHDTLEAVEAMALDVERTFYSEAAAMLRRLHQRAVEAEMERDAQKLLAAEAVIACNNAHRDRMRAEREAHTARADALRAAVAVPGKVSESDAPKCIGKFEALSWALGWNGCRDAMLAASLYTND